MKQILLLIFGILLLTGCASQATFGDAITEGEPTPIPTPIVPNKPVYEVQRGDIVYERRYIGRVSPINTSNLVFQLDGQVLEILFAPGDDVKAGDILAKLDTSDLEEQLLIAETDLEVAQSIFDSANDQAVFSRRRAELNLDLVQLQLDYAVSQADEPPNEQDELTIRTREIERDLAQLALDEIDEGIDPELRLNVVRAQNRVDDLQEMIANTQLVAPMDGRLVYFPISVGDQVIAFERIGEVADITQLEVTDVLLTSDVSELTEGMPVALQQASVPGEVYLGSIFALPPPYGTGTDESVHIRFEVPPDSNEIVLGDRMSFTITIEESNNVLWLPASAIRQFNGRDFVVIQNDSIQQRVDVKLGLEGDSRVEILEGLEEDQVVIGP